MRMFFCLLGFFMLCGVRGAELEFRPSFNACSYYFKAPGDGYAAEYRRAGTQEWLGILPPVRDLPAGLWKGGVVNLKEDAAYELRVRTLKDGGIAASGTFKTWSSKVTVGRTVDLSLLKAEPGKPLVIRDKGKADAWVKYTAPPGWVLRCGYGKENPVPALIFKEAEYVLLENVRIEGGGRHAVEVMSSRDVRIVNCDISGWGRLGEQNFTDEAKRIGVYLDGAGKIINYDAGISISRSLNTVVERCYIHDPRSRANSWMFSHPTGPCAVLMNHADGGTVLRWNDFVGSDEHRWNDVIEGIGNDAADGGFHRDADICGNFLAFGNDDGAELEGGGMNVRFYGNRVEGTLCGVSSGACIYGPQYIFGNLFINPGDESGLHLMAFKNGHGTAQGGRRYFINNTAVGDNYTAYGNYGKPILEHGTIGYMRNNVLACRQGGAMAAGRDDFDYNLFHAQGGTASAETLESFRNAGYERHGVAADPKFASPEKGDYRVTAADVGNMGCGVDNFIESGREPGAYGMFPDGLPWRPVSWSLDRSVCELVNGKTVVVKLSNPSTAAKPLKFSLRKNRVCGWFKVEPSEGEVEPGRAVELRVDAIPGALIGRPYFRGAFMVVDTDGFSRPISVYAKGDMDAVPRYVSMPGAAIINMSEQDIPGAVRAGQGMLRLEPGKEELRVNFDLDEEGVYALLARVAIDPASGTRRELGFALDNGGMCTATIHPSYQWNVSERANPRYVWLAGLGKLSAGKHSMSLRQLRGDLVLDQVVISRDPGLFFIQHLHRNRQ